MKTPKYRKHSQRDFGFIEFQGKRVRFPGGYQSKESLCAYQKFLRENGFCKVESANTVADVLLAWLDFAVDTYGGKRGSNQYTCVKSRTIRPLVAAHENTAVGEFGPRALKEFMRSLAPSRARRYANLTLGDVKRIWKWAASEELIPVENYQALATVQAFQRGRSPARETSPRHPVDFETVERTVAVMHAVGRAMVLCQWYTGARSRSVVNATPSQFDRSSDVWMWRPVHKTENRGTKLVLPIGPRCQEVLQPFMDRDDDTPLFQPRASRRGPYNDRYSTTSYRHLVVRSAKEAGVEHWVPHQLRHARSTIVRKEYGLEAAQAVLGHDSIDSTQIYAGKLVEVAVRVAKEIG